MGHSTSPLPRLCATNCSSVPDTRLDVSSYHETAHASSLESPLLAASVAPLSHRIEHSRVFPIAHSIYRRHGWYAGHGLAGDVLAAPGEVGLFPSGYRASRIDRTRLDWRMRSANVASPQCLPFPHGVLGRPIGNPDLLSLVHWSDHSAGGNCISDWLRPTSLEIVLTLS
jgi:hypothetical protein